MATTNDNVSRGGIFYNHHSWLAAGLAGLAFGAFSGTVVGRPDQVHHNSLRRHYYHLCPSLTGWPGLLNHPAESEPENHASVSQNELLFPTIQHTTYFQEPRSGGRSMEKYK